MYSIFKNTVYMRKWNTSLKDVDNLDTLAVLLMQNITSLSSDITKWSHRRFLYSLEAPQALKMQHNWILVKKSTTYVLALIKLHLCLKENYSEISAHQAFSQSARCPWTDILSDTQMKKTLVYQFTLQMLSLETLFPFLL